MMSLQWLLSSAYNFSPRKPLGGTIPKHFLQAGAFDVQRLVTVDIVKLERNSES